MPETLIAPDPTQPDASQAPPPEEAKGVALFDNTLAAFRDTVLETAKAKPKEEAKAKTEDKPKETAKPEVTAKEEEEKPKAEQADKTAEVEPEPEQKPKRRRRQLDEQEIASVAASAAAKASAETAARMAEKPASQPPAAKPQEPEIDFDVPEETRYKLEIIQEMESDPKHKGKRAEYVKWLKEVDQYQRKWQDEHPDEEFDPESDDHNKLFNKEPKLPERDYDIARLRLADKGRDNDEVKQLKAEQATLKAKLEEQSLAPEIANRGRVALSKILGAINADYAKHADSEDQLVKLSEEDPEALELAAGAAKAVVPFIGEVVKLWQPSGATTFNPSNPVHVEIADFARTLEEAVSKMPDHERVRGGKRFATMAQWQTMSESAKKSSWSFMDKDVLIGFRIASAVEETRKTHQELEKRLEAYAKRRGLIRETAPEQKKPEPIKETVKEPSSPPPAGAGRSAVDTSSSATPQKPTDFGDFFLSKMRGR